MSDLSLNAERRAQDAPPRPGAGLQGPEAGAPRRVVPTFGADVARSIGRSGVTAEQRRRLSALEQRTPGAGLTRRERRVKEILLQELDKITKQQKTWTSYQEKKHVYETLNVDFLDKEIERMEHQLRPRPFLWVSVSVLALAMSAYYLAQAASGPFGWSAILQIVLGLSYPVLIWFGQAHARKATRRRLFIYEALRELSDAEDDGVELTEVVARADLLIDRITALELEDDPAPLGHPRSRTRA